MKVYNHHSLINYNTFGVGAIASTFIQVDKEEEYRDALRNFYGEGKKILFLGGGSNILFTEDFDGIVIHLATRGVEVVSRYQGKVILRVQAGEVWDNLVIHAVDNGWYGLENLSGIPGMVGSSPIQNIGAYGAELKDVFVELEALDIHDLSIRTFNAEDCRFGYRDSIFKHDLKGRYLIQSVTLELTETARINLRYNALREKLEPLSEAEITPSVVRQAVLDIRRSKLPDPSVIGNAGSFFKNPLVTLDKFTELQQAYPGMPSFPAGKGMVKIAAGWLIEKCGWKGYRRNDAGVYHLQALVLVNHGRASGKEILSLASDIIDSVEDEFNIRLQPEVNIL